MRQPIRLLWSRGRGVAEFDGMRIPLTTRPDIPGLPEMTEMDYLPGQCADVRERHDARRDLNGDEIKSVIEWLAARTAAAQDTFSRESTIAVVVIR